MKSAVLVCSLLTALLASPLDAQVDYTRAGQPYTQNFDHPEAFMSGPFAWNDNQTFPGWFATYYEGSRSRYSPVESIFATSGSGRNEQAFYLYRSDSVRGASLAAPDCALGSQSSDQRCPGVGAGGIFYGVALVNRTGETLDTLRLSFLVELWRLATTPPTQTTLTVSVRVGGKDLTDGSWMLVPGGVYATPRGGDGESVQARSLDGNAPENVKAFSDLTLSGLALAPGETVWVRWFDVNNSFADHGIGLDDVSLTLLP